MLWYNYLIVIAFLLVISYTLVMNLTSWTPKLRIINLGNMIPSKIPSFFKNKKLWKWPVGIAVGLLLVFFGIPWVWQKANPAFDAIIAFGERRNEPSYSCKVEEERSSVDYTKTARADAPTVDTIPQGWNLQKWTEEDKLERELSRSGPLLIETNRVKSGADSVHIAFRLHKIVC